MPELPEVETIACDLRNRGLTGATVGGVRVLQPLVVRGAGSLEGLAGRRIESVARHGKLLLIGLRGGLSLIIHLKMTGQLLLASADEPLPKHTHVVIELGRGRQLRFRDVRRFGYLCLVDAAGRERTLSALGPDALTVGEAPLRELLRSRRALLKPLLMNQGVLAGLGNIYANEILFEARLSPWRRAGSLSAAEVRRLHRAMRSVLDQAISCRGSTTSDFVDAGGRSGSFQERHHVYRKERCPRCGARVIRELRGGRPAFYCPVCQPARSPT